MRGSPRRTSCCIRTKTRVTSESALRLIEEARGQGQVLAWSRVCQAIIQLVQLAIDAGDADEIRMAAPLHDPALFHHQDLIRIDHGVEPVGDHQRCSALRYLAESLDHVLFRL